MSWTGECFEAFLNGLIREVEHEGLSGSDHLDGAGVSSDDQDSGDHLPGKRNCHRHTPFQIKQLEAFFKTCHLPDEKQRLDLSEKLNLDVKQVKFWFQNRRTQLKNQSERHDNMVLKLEKEKLLAENLAIQEALQNPICSKCSGPADLGGHLLKFENARLKDELSRVSFLADKFLGKSMLPSDSGLDPTVVRNDLDIPDPVGDMLPVGVEEVLNSSMETLGRPLSMENGDGSFFLKHALTAAEELISMVETGSPLWQRNLNGWKEVLNYDEYKRKFDPPCLGPKPIDFVTEATRETGTVNISCLDLVETLMDVEQWNTMFPHLVAGSSIIEVISNGVCGTRNGALQLMQAEFRVMTPLVEARKVKFLRFCKQHADGLWAVVDVSLKRAQDPSNDNSFTTCRRLPSGCVVQDAQVGYSKVTWLEHSDYDESNIHPLFRSMISSGLGFGAPKWLATLQRHCEYRALLGAPTLVVPQIPLIGREKMVKLAQRMVDKFCNGVSSSAEHSLEVVDLKIPGLDLKLMARRGMDELDPEGVLLNAVTSVWVPWPHLKLFGFLRDEQMRAQWDVLANNEPMLEVMNMVKGWQQSNCISLLLTGVKYLNQDQENMLILQETWTDASGSLIVYSPVPSNGIYTIMNGGEWDRIPLLPSGFMIVPDGYSQNGASSSSGLANDGRMDQLGWSGSLLTMGFEITGSEVLDSNFSPDSIRTLTNLICTTLGGVRSACVGMVDLGNE